ncbi:hypothetical protein D6C91_02220 [Aureobasidium pullulans]|uniref:Uncharacterized protein n=1 Tax=Aureobasidium pullulans TaxID=5580 RepID=A0A4S9TSN3_AURPU|nr:hypothetical protein D6C91_02220 [Aureobasidium pullulans]
MRLAPCVLLPAAVAAAKASLGNLYIHNEQVSGDQPVLSLKADAARLVIASRLGLDQYHSLQGQDDKSLQTIDRLAGSSSFLSSQDLSVALILSTVGQEDVPFSLSDSAHVQTIQIKDSPDFQSSEKLFKHLAQQSGIDNLDHVQQSTVSSYTGPAFRIAEDSEALASAFKVLTSQYHTVLVLNVPKDTSKNTYGSYDADVKSHQKRQFKEAPLITEATKTASHLKATLTPDASSNKTYNQTGPLRGILPGCFSSLSTCQSMTRNCTGHGSCVLKHTDRDAGDLGGKCYSCACQDDVHTNANGGKKTTRWGGPACQKKDIVMPFWLISSFSVFLVFLVSWGVGLLYTMGSQELPSVIGAGVSGPVRK